MAGFVNLYGNTNSDLLIISHQGEEEFHYHGVKLVPVEYLPLFVGERLAMIFWRDNIEFLRYHDLESLTQYFRHYYNGCKAHCTVIQPESLNGLNRAEMQRKLDEAQ